jgi:hypothetical protein
MQDRLRGNGVLMGFEVCSDFRVSAVLGTVFTFQIIYIFMQTKK